MFYPNLFGSIKIGTTIIKNRIVMAPMNTNFADPEGFVTRKFVDYYLARARGGTGLIMISAAVIDEKAKRRTGNLAIYDDTFIDGLANLAKGIKDAGSAVFQQLNHVGRLVKSMTIPDSKYQPVGPSAIPHPLSGEICKELKLEEMEEIVRKFTRASVRVKRAGFDGLELHGAHGYLLNQFLSPYTNKRNDEYGGNLSNRMKLPLEVVKGVRAVVGEEFLISYRISAKEFVPSGLDIDEIKTFVQELEKSGVNIIHVSGGISETPATLEKMMPPMSTPSGCFVPFAAEIRKVVRIPVIVVGKIDTPRLGEEIIREGKADMVAMGRSLIADPDLPTKAKEGRVEEIRKCVYCNQGCIERLIQEMEITCTVNPTVGKEGEYQIVPAKKSKKIFIVGGGPAGLEAARVTALRGHNVTLFEKTDKLGGQINIACVPPGKSELKNIIEYYSRQLGKLSVNIILNNEVTITHIEKENPDAVIFATGANPIRPEVPGMEAENVFMANEVLKNNFKVEDEIAVIGGGQVGLEVALFLAHKGKKVKIVEMLEDIGSDMGPLNRYRIKEDLKAFGVDILSNTKFVSVNKDRIQVEKDGRIITIPNIKTLIFAIGFQSNDVLAEEVRRGGMEGKIIEIGDCNRPRKILDAIYEGLMAGLEI